MPTPRYNTHNAPPTTSSLFASPALGSSKIPRAPAHTAAAANASVSAAAGHSNTAGGPSNTAAGNATNATNTGSNTATASNTGSLAAPPTVAGFVTPAPAGVLCVGVVCVC